MGSTRFVTKTSKETLEDYQRWIFTQDPSKDYSDFRYVDGMMQKLAEYLWETDQAKMQTFLEFAEDNEGVDFADFIIQELGRENEGGS